MLKKLRASGLPACRNSSRSFSVVTDTERRLEENDQKARLYRAVVSRDVIIKDLVTTVLMLQNKIEEGFKEMSDEPREIPHRPPPAAIEAPATIGGVEAPNPTATYADTIQKCHVFYRHSFQDDGFIIVKTISLAFGRNMEQVKRHLKQGHT